MDVGPRITRIFYSDVGTIRYGSDKLGFVHVSQDTRVQEMKNGVAHAGDERFDYLLDVAATLFLSKGFAATSVGEIAAQAKASKSTFYSRYPTKEKLFTEVFRRRADAAFHEFSSILLPEAEPRQVLCQLGESLLRCVLAPDSIDLLRLVYTESRHIPELGRIFHALGPAKGNQQTSEYFQKLVTRGFFRSDMDTLLGAEQFANLLTGELVRRSVLAIEPVFTPEEQVYRLRSAVDMFIRAYRS